MLAIAGRARDQAWVAKTQAAILLEEKVGQLFIADLVALYSHRQIPNSRYAPKMVQRQHTGSFILGGGTFTDIAGMTSTLPKFRCASTQISKAVAPTMCPGSGAG